MDTAIELQDTATCNQSQFVIDERSSLKVLFFKHVDQFIKSTFAYKKLIKLEKLVAKDEEVKTTEKIGDAMTFTSQRHYFKPLVPKTLFLSTAFLLLLDKDSERNYIELVGAGHSISSMEPIEDQRFAICFALT